ncbi:MAG: hypothetical protein ACHQK9_07255 [Reyranellales bacterium]
MHNQRFQTPTVSQIMLLAAALLAGSLAWCGTAAAAETPAAKLPQSLVDVGEFGENIYDAAKAKDWTTAGGKLASLKEAAGRLKKDLAGADAEQRKNLDQLDIAIAAVAKAISAQERQTTMELANRVTLIAADLTEPFHPQPPVAVTRLDYLGRELEIWAATGDLKKLQSAADELVAVWEKVRPGIEAKGGTAEATAFGKLVGQLKQAKAAGEYGKLATPILDEVDNLEKVYKK